MKNLVTVLLFICASVLAETPTERAEKDYKAAVEAARKVLVAKLTTEMQVLTKKGDLDGAVKLRDLIKSYDPAPAEVVKVSGELIDLSKTATYKTSSNWKNIKALSKLLDGAGGGYNSNGDGDGNEYAFCTNQEANPYIIIDLGKLSNVSKLNVVNRKGDPQFAAWAATLTVYSSNNGTGPWQEIWRTDKAQDEWLIDKSFSTRFIKIGLRDKQYFNLHSVVILGK